MQSSLVRGGRCGVLGSDGRPEKDGSPDVCQSAGVHVVLLRAQGEAVEEVHQHCQGRAAKGREFVDQRADSPRSVRVILS